MFGIGHSAAGQDSLAADQVRHLQALEASALWTHMQLSELLRTLRHPSPFEIAPAIRRVELSEIALMDYARELGLL